MEYKKESVGCNFTSAIEALVKGNVFNGLPSVDVVEDAAISGVLRHETDVV